MSILILPQEVLALISKYTINHEYLLVCKYWLNSFRPSLYEHVNVNSRRQFKKLIYTIQQNKYLGIYVKHLNFDYNIGITQQEFNDILPNCFPLLQTLDFNPKLWKHIRECKNVTIPWKRLMKLPTMNRTQITLPLLKTYGGTLLHMTLSGNIVHELQANNQLFDLFQHTPQLTSLKLYGRDASCDPISTSSYQSAEFTLLDIQNIHKLLSKLESLELIYVALSIWSSPTPELELTPNIFMQKFSLTHSELYHHQWIISIANLYPNLKILELNNLKWRETYKQNVMDKEVIQSCYAYLANHCSRLEKVYLDSSIKSANQVFYQTLKSGNRNHLISIENGINPITATASDLKLLAHTILQCTDAQKTTCLQMQLWRDLRYIENIIQPISKACHSLQELELIGGKFSFSWNYGCDLDVITKYCPQLVTLKLSMARMTISKNKEDAPHHSKIKSIVLEKAHFSSEAINSIPLLCPRLKRLEMIDCVKDRDSLEQKIRLDLSDLALDTLIVKRLYLRSSNFTERSGIDTAIIAVEYKERTSKYVRRTSNSLIDDYDGVRWYHLCNKKTSNERNMRLLKRLGDAQSRQIKEYRMKEKDWDLLEETSFRGTYRDEKYWKTDIPYGYIYVSCHSIDNLIFNKVAI